MVFALRLDNGPRTYDFRAGKTGWGHALHSFTWKDAPSRYERRGFLRRRVEVAKRITVAVHTSPMPRTGDRALITGASGRDWNMAVVAVEPFGDPRDMHRLTLEFDRPPEPEVEAAPTRAPQAEREDSREANNV